MQNKIQHEIDSNTFMIHAKYNNVITYSLKVKRQRDTKDFCLLPNTISSFQASSNMNPQTK